MGFRQYVKDMIDKLGERTEASSLRHQAIERRVATLEKQLVLLQGASRAEGIPRRRLDGLLPDPEPWKQGRTIATEGLHAVVTDHRDLVEGLRQMGCDGLRGRALDIGCGARTSGTYGSTGPRNAEEIAKDIAAFREVPLLASYFDRPAVEPGDDARDQLKEYEDLVAALEKMGGRQLLQRARNAARRPVKVRSASCGGIVPSSSGSSDVAEQLPEPVTRAMALPPGATVRHTSTGRIGIFTRYWQSVVPSVHDRLPDIAVDFPESPGEGPYKQREFEIVSAPELDDSEENAVKVLAEAREAEDRAGARIEVVHALVAHVERCYDAAYRHTGGPPSQDVVVDTIRKAYRHWSAAGALETTVPAAPAAIGQSRASLAGDVVRLASLVVDRPAGYALVPIVGDKPDLPPEGYLFAETIEKRYPVVLKADVVDASILSPADSQVRKEREPPPPKLVKEDQCRTNESGGVVHVDKIEADGTCRLMYVVGSRPGVRAVSMARERVQIVFPIVLVEPVVRRMLLDPAQRLSLGVLPKDVAPMDEEPEESS